MNDELQHYLLKFYSKNLDEITEADLTGLRAFADRLRLSDSDMGYALRTELFVRIHHVRCATPQTYRKLRSLCEAYERTPRFVETSPGNRCFVKIASAHASLVASFDYALDPATRAQEFERARKELESARKLLDVYGVAELRDDVARWESMRSSIAAGNVSTAIRFDIPLVFPVPDGEYQIHFNGLPTTLRVAYRPPTTPRFGLNVEEKGISFEVLQGNALDWLNLSPAEHGTRVESLTSSRVAVGFTSVVAIFPKSIDVYAPPRQGEGFDPTAPLTPLQTRRYPESVQLATALLNRFIDHLRVVSGRFDIVRLAPSDIEAFAMVLLVAGQPLFAVPLVTGGGPYHVVVDTAPTPTWLDEFTARLRSNEEISTEDLLLVDAQRLLMEGELRLSVLNTNAALESFVNRHFRTRMASAPAESVEVFLRGTSTFESCRSELIHLAKAGDRSAGNAADLMPTPDVPVEARRKPSVFQMVVKMHQHRPFGVSRTKLTALINRIRGRRNDVAHGQLSDAALDPTTVYMSIEALKSFLRDAKATLPTD